MEKKKWVTIFTIGDIERMLQAMQKNNARSIFLEGEKIDKKHISYSAYDKDIEDVNKHLWQ